MAAAEGLVASVVDPKAAQVATGGNQTVTNQPWDAHLEEPCLQLYSQDVIYIYILYNYMYILYVMVIHQERRDMNITTCDGLSELRSYRVLQLLQGCYRVRTSIIKNIKEHQRTLKNIKEH